MKQHDCKEELRKVNLRATPARLAVMKFLEAAGEPVDTNTIIDFVNNKGIKTNPATVFRIINMFIQKGLTIPIQFQEGKTRYELANRKHHHHLVCEKCGKIENVLGHFPCALEKQIQGKHKFLVKRHSLEFFGLCQDCQS
jgi:Fur family ferric uptake transcriptional regulator